MCRIEQKFELVPSIFKPSQSKRALRQINEGLEKLEKFELSAMTGSLEPAFSDASYSSPVTEESSASGFLFTGTPDFDREARERIGACYGINMN